METLWLISHLPQEHKGKKEREEKNRKPLQSLEFSKIDFLYCINDNKYPFDSKCYFMDSTWRCCKSSLSIAIFNYKLRNGINPNCIVKRSANSIWMLLPSTRINCYISVCLCLTVYLSSLFTPILLLPSPPISEVYWRESKYYLLC